MNRLYKITAIGTILSFGLMFVNFIVFAPLTFLFFIGLCYWYYQINK